MKHSFKRIIPLFLLVLLIFPVSVFLSAEEAPQEALNAARQGICDFVKAERSSAYSSQPNSNVLAVENGEVQKGFQVFTVSPNQLMNQSDLNTMLKPTGLWRFVVTKDQQPVSLVSVAFVDGQWRAVSLGGATLATQVNSVMKAWPMSEGYDFRFVRIYQARTDLMQISKDGNVMGFVPMAAARKAFKIDGAFNPTLLMRSDEIQKPLRTLVEEELTQMTTVK